MAHYLLISNIEIKICYKLGWASLKSRCACQEEARMKRVKSLSVIVPMVILFLFSFAPSALSSCNELSKELSYFKKNYSRVKRIQIGPNNVDQLRSGKYPKTVVEKVFGFRKGDTQVYWILVPLYGGNQNVGVNIRTRRGTESNYEFLQYSRPRGNSSCGETRSSMPGFRNQGGKIDYLLLIKRKMQGGRTSRPSDSVETQVTFTYQPR
jgi:hypothetical protein